MPSPAEITAQPETRAAIRAWGRAARPAACSTNVTVGNDSQDCKGKNDCFRPSGTYGVLSLSDSRYEPAFQTHTGYDFPSGIGTIDAANLVNAWARALPVAAASETTQ